jgi:hypothetical protein
MCHLRFLGLLLLLGRLRYRALAAMAGIGHRRFMPLVAPHPGAGAFKLDCAPRWVGGGGHQAGGAGRSGEGGLGPLGECAHKTATAVAAADAAGRCGGTLASWMRGSGTEREAVLAHGLAGPGHGAQHALSWARAAQPAQPGCTTPVLQAMMPGLAPAPSPAQERSKESTPCPRTSISRRRSCCSAAGRFVLGHGQICHRGA